MSSTNRSKARDVHIADYYVTPVSSIVDFLMEFFSDNPDLDFDGSRILDPCAGGDIEHPMSYPTAINKWDYEKKPFIETVDIRQDSLATVKTCFLINYKESGFDVVITNPPFNIALDVIKKSLAITVDGGLVIMLLRLNFFGSRVRSEWFQNNMPKWCYVHSKRMKFLNTGGTDSIEYCHCVWVKGEYPKFTQMRVI